MTIKEIIDENDRRKAVIEAIYDPLTGEGAVGERFALTLSDYPTPTQYIPIALKDNLFIKNLEKAGSINNFLTSLITKGIAYEENREEDRDKVIKHLVKLRALHDFCFWSYSFVFIKNKEGGDDINFYLNIPQRKLVAKLEAMRLNDKPIRLILLKARQWGGSTCIQTYMAWIQLMWRKGWNSLVVSHVMQSTTEVKGMFTKLMDNYPLWMLHDDFEIFNEKEKKIIPFEGSQSIDLIPQRNSKIKTGTAESPESARGGDSAMVHCTEVAFWKTTEKKTPKQIIRSACSGVLYAPYTIEVFETTANGTGNYFYDEWNRAIDGTSDKEPLFISWFDIEMYSMPIQDVELFANNLIRDSDNNNTDGAYNYWLWQQGATLEAINWYNFKRKGYDDHSDMAAEYPSDAIEAFKHSGQKIFNIYDVEKMKYSCHSPKYIGEVRANSDSGVEALQNLHFVNSENGCLKIWEYPQKENIKNRYLVVVDVGGRSSTSDYSVIWVMDRYWLIDGDKPCTAAEWCGHIRHDLLAWKSAQIAKYYNNALLVIESNTLETKDKERDTDGTHTEYILEEISDFYDNLYARESSQEDIKIGAPKKWGFHTNVNSKNRIIDNLITIIETQGYVERDIATIEEYLTYEKKKNGSYGAIAGKHDDKLMTRAIGLDVSKKMDLPKIIDDANAVQRRKNIGLASTI